MTKTNNGLKFTDNDELIVAPTGGGGTGTSASQVLGAYTTPTVLQNAAVAIGDGTSFTVAGLSSLMLEISGTFSGVVTFEAQTPAGSWMTINGKPVGGSQLVTTTLTTGSWSFYIAGFIAFRARISTYVSGAITATAIGSYAADHNSIQNENLATALDEDIDAIAGYEKAYTYTRIAADTAISAVPVGLCGYYVEASSSGVISLYDNASAASGNAMIALSKAITTNDLVLLETPIAMTNGVFFDLVSGTATVSVLTRKAIAA